MTTLSYKHTELNQAMRTFHRLMESAYMVFVGDADHSMSLKKKNSKPKYLLIKKNRDHRDVSLNNVVYFVK